MSQVHLTDIAIAILKRARARIIAKPKFYDFATFAQKTECGTIGCITGYVIVSSKNTKRISPDRDGENFTLAQEILGLSVEDARTLFIHWPERFNSNSPKDAARRITHFIKTGE